MKKRNIDVFSLSRAFVPLDFWFQKLTTAEGPQNRQQIFSETPVVLSRLARVHVFPTTLFFSSNRPASTHTYYYAYGQAPPPSESYRLQACSFVVVVSSYRGVFRNTSELNRIYPAAAT